MAHRQVRTRTIHTLLTVQALAKATRLSPRTIRRDIAHRELPAFIVGQRVYRIPRPAAADYMRRTTGCSRRQALTTLDRYSRAIPLGDLGNVGDGELMKLSSVAAVLATTPQHVRNLIRRREIGYTTILGLRYVPLSALLDFLFREPPPCVRMS
jgi:excisionase family DNA binding protein